MTVGVGSLDVGWNSRPSKVTTHAGSPDAQSLSLRSDCGHRKSRRESELPTVRSPDPSRESRHLGFCWAAVCARRKSRRTLELPTVGSPNPKPGVPTPCLAGQLTAFVGSPDVSQNSRRLEVTTLVGSSDSQSLSLHGDCGHRKSRRESELPTVGSPDPSWESRHRWFCWPAVCARRNSRPMSGVPIPVAGWLGV